MLAIFQSVLPIFLVIIFGNLLRRAPVFPAEFWPGLDRLGFYVLYPVLLFATVLKADFSGLTLGTVMIVLAACWGILGVLTLALWPLLRGLGMARATYSSVFQSTIRWNGFIALVVAEKLFPPEGVAMVALAMAFVVIPINVATVAVVAWFTDNSPNLGSVLRRVAVNPLILGTAAALIMRQVPGALPGPVFDAIHLVARAALGMGLVAIGAGLRIADTLKPSAGMFVPVVLKLVAFPALVVGTALAAGLSGPEVSYLALCAAVPTAMNGYVLARQMGGDAESYAATATVQTALSFFTLPAVLAITAQLAGG